MSRYENRYEIRSHVRPWGRRWTFVLRSANGQIVATSEPYSSRQAAERGIETLRRIAAQAARPS